MRREWVNIVKGAHHLPKFSPEVFIIEVWCSLSPSSFFPLHTEGELRLSEAIKIDSAEQTESVAQQKARPEMLAFFVAYLLCALALSSVDGFSLKTTNNVARSLSTQLDYKVRLINKKKNSDVTFECPPNKVFARYLPCVNPTLPSFHPMLCYAMLSYPTPNPIPLPTFYTYKVHFGRS